MIRHKALAWVLAATTLVVAAFAQGADDFPHKPIRVIVAYPPGGSTDIIARILGQKLTDRFGQTMLVDNRAGAAGMLGAALVAQSTADGYTLLLSDTPFVVNPSVFAKVPYDPIRDFTPIVMVAQSPMMLVVNATVPAQSLQDLIKLAKAQPGKYTIGSAGTGASSHVVAELFKMRAGVNLTHVPYKGLGPALAEVAGGQINSVFSSIPAAMPLVKSGKLRVLGVCSQRRVTVAPEVPTMEEGGVRDFEAAIWYGYQGPAGLPKPVVGKLSTEISRAAQLPDVRERFLGVGLEPLILMPKEFHAYVAADLKKWADVVKAANIKAE
ncbi:MAG TPA: tripartite tricarboxylate transporter substrate binding protein [Burkholderiales bacterium]|nr:tripartite tricarboxylate transporter substrate binding protein [Burkholderiales bacterium]